MKGMSKKGRKLQEHPGVFIISYPKVGRTWLRTLLGKSLCEMNNLPEDKLLQTGYITVASGLPLTIFTHDGSDLKARKPYQELSSDKSFYKDKKVLLLSRNVKDTLVSAYFQARKRIGLFKGSLPRFIRSDLYGAKKMLTFYQYWYENREVPRDFLFIRYEEMHENPKDVLDRTLSYLGVPEVDDQVLEVATSFSSFHNLKRLESEHRFGSPRLAPKNVKDPESFKVRRGTVGGWADYLSTEDTEYINDLTSRYHDNPFITS